MSNPVEFLTISCSGRIEAMLGSVLVGIISPYPTSGKSLSTVGATYQFLMPVKGASQIVPKPMSSMIAARRSLLHRLAEWHEEASPHLYAAMIEALRAQAEGER